MKKFLESGISVVTANKIANSQSVKRYKILRALSVKHDVKFLYETNVGAGLPVIETLRSMIESGDEIKSIEAILSGTLSYIFNTYKPGIAFSEVVLQAKNSGYTEPDPRIDLSGMDVARKMLILARECGAEIELNNIEIEGFLPEACTKAGSVDDFFKVLKENDFIFQEMLNKSLSKNEVLRYIASFKENSISVSLQSVSQEHPFYSLKGSDNIVAFTTERYNQTPLVIKGPGAGAQVTAAGVLSDILKVLVR